MAKHKNCINRIKLIVQERQSGPYLMIPNEIITV